MILGIRAAGIFLIAWGTAAPGLFSGLIIQAAFRGRPDEPGWAAMGLLDRVMFLLKSKEFLFQWWQVGGMWMCGLLLGVYLMRRDARRVVSVMRFAK
jgi:hypothetical protein